LRGRAASSLFAKGTRFATRRTGLSVFVAFLRAAILGNPNAKPSGGTRRDKDPDSILKTIINCLQSLSRHASREKWRRHDIARRLCKCKAYGKKIATYVRLRTEPMEFEGENCPYARQPTKKGAPESLAQNRPRIGSDAYLTSGSRIQPRKDINMLYTIAVVLIILWLLGLVTSYTMGGLIHVLLVIAIIVILLRVISGRSAL
jgi:hypothetical protein